MDLWLKYKRVGEKYEGEFAFDAKESIGSGTYEWNELLRQLAILLSAFPQVGLVLHRADHEFAMPSRIGEAETQLFRTDPAQAIRNWTFQNSTITNPMAPIPVGYEVLPSAFGDHVYLGFVRGHVESPFTGDLFSVAIDDDGWIRDSALGIPMQEVTPNWVTCSVADLLASGADTFFIPREWNPTPPWISREELESRYNKYLEEKSKAQ